LSSNIKTGKGETRQKFGHANIELEHPGRGKRKNARTKLKIANIEIEHQIEEREKRLLQELIISKINLFQKEEKAKTGAELIISKIKFAQAREENEKFGGKELIIANLCGPPFNRTLIVAKEKVQKRNESN